MDLLDLIAHVTLDTSEYEAALEDAQKAAEALDIKEDYSLGLDTSGFSESLEGVKTEATTFGSSMDEIWGGLAEGLTKAGITAAITGLATMLSNSVSLARELGDNIDKGSKRLNISTDAYQQWGHALKQSGANINDLQHGIATMNKVLGGGTITKTAAAAFDRLGVSATNANGELKNTETLLTDTVTALADFSGTNEERGALAQAIFGSASGNKLSALFDEGAEGIHNLINEANELGLVMTSEEIANAVDFGDAISNMQSALDGLQTSLATSIIPALTNAVNMVTKIVTFFNWRDGDAPLGEQFESIDQGAADSVESINATESAAMTLADKLIAMGDASKLTAEQQEIWKGTAEALIGLVPQLSDVINLDTESITGNSDAIRDNIKAWAEKARAEAATQALADKRAALAQKTKEWLNAETEANIALADSQAEMVKAASAANNVLAEVGSSLRVKEDGSDFNEVIKQAMSTFADMGDAGETEAAKLGSVLTQYGEAWTEAAEKKQAAMDLAAEVEAGKQELAKYETAINEVLESATAGAGEAEGAVGDVGTALDGLPDRKRIVIDVVANYPNLSWLKDTPHASFAKGAWDIPYDDFPALLHKNEMVLTASQARQYREGKSNLSDVSAIVDAIQSLGNRMARMSMTVGGKEFAKVVTDFAGRSLYEDAGARNQRMLSGYGW